MLSPAKAPDIAPTFAVPRTTSSKALLVSKENRTRSSRRPAPSVAPVPASPPSTQNDQLVYLRHRVTEHAEHPREPLRALAEPPATPSQPRAATIPTETPNSAAPREFLKTPTTAVPLKLLFGNKRTGLSRGGATRILPSEIPVQPVVNLGDRAPENAVPKLISPPASPVPTTTQSPSESGITAPADSTAASRITRALQKHVSNANSTSADGDSAPQLPPGALPGAAATKPRLPLSELRSLSEEKEADPKESNRRESWDGAEGTTSSPSVALDDELARLRALEKQRHRRHREQREQLRLQQQQTQLQQPPPQLPPSSISAQPTSLALPSAPPAASTAPQTASTPRSYISVSGRRFEALRVLGSGGSSRVYQVLSSEREMLALKRVVLDDQASSTAEVLAMFQKEVVLLERLKGSDCVVHLLGHERRPGELLVLMELGEETLHAILAAEIRRGGGTAATPRPPRVLPSGLPLNNVRLYWQQTLECVTAVHDAGIVHCDLKPANLVLFRGRLKLIDFGIAVESPADAPVQFSDTVVGTVNYMPPEALRHVLEPNITRADCTPKSDVWSLGCILYQMIFGRSPFSKHQDKMEKVHAICYSRKGVPLIEGLPPAVSEPLRHTVQSCLQRDVAARPSARDLLLLDAYQF